MSRGYQPKGGTPPSNLPFKVGVRCAPRKYELDDKTFKALQDAVGLAVKERVDQNLKEALNRIGQKLGHEYIKKEDK